MATKIEYIPFADQQVEGDWRVEAINEKEGEVYIAIFSGPGCEKRAHEYAAFKNGKHPLSAPKPVVAPPVPVPAPAAPVAEKLSRGEFRIRTTDNGTLVVRPHEMNWKFDKIRKTLSGKPKPAIERIDGITVEKEEK